MDSMSIVGSSPLESEGDRFRIDAEWNGEIPDLFYCVSCESIFLSREDITRHFCPGGCANKVEPKGDCLEYFVSWLLPQLIDGKRFPKNFDHDLFTRLREDKLVGAPMDCYLGGFLLWVVTKTKGKNIDCQKNFVRQLFNYPRPEINWKILYSLSTKIISPSPYLKQTDYDHVQPTICIYDVDKKAVRDVNDIYKNCYDDGYDKDDYRDMKDGKYFDVEEELYRLSESIAGHPYGDIVIKKNETVAEILRSEKEISKSDALFILSCSHKFTVDDAGRFLKLFPKESAMRFLDNKTQLRYNHVQFIWSHYGPKEDTVCLDPDDPATYIHFDGNSIWESFPILDRFYYCGKPIRGGPIFELLSITIRDLGPNRDFSSIYMQSKSRKGIPLIVYKLPEGKEVDIGKPLPLKGPFRLPNPKSDVVISFSTSNTLEDSWKFVHDGNYYSARLGHPEYSKIVTTKICMDYRSSSLATIKYRLSSYGVRALLAFTFFGDLNQMITITDGYIVATDDGDVSTMRVVKEYDEETPVCLHSGQRLPVDRCVLGMLGDCYLRVKVKLVYFVDTSLDEKRMIEGYHDFKMPEYVSTQGLTMPASYCSSADRLCVECFWTSYK
jgi:hypothetical protein